MPGFCPRFPRAPNVCLLWNKAQEWISLALPPPPSHSPAVLTCALQVGEGAPSWAAGLEPLPLARGWQAQEEGAEREQEGALSEEAAEKVGVGVSQPRRRRREKEVGELGRIIPSCQLSVSRTGRVEANWFVAQNSRWGIESWKMTAGKSLRNQAHLHLPSQFYGGIN